MSEVETVKAVTSDGSVSAWEVAWDYEGEDFALTLSEPGGGKNWSAQGPDLFDAFCDIRRRLEREGVKICVSGARVDAYPSGMSREMGGGQMVYLWKSGRFRSLLQALISRPKLVYIFSPAPCDLVGTVDEQKSYFDRWVSGEL